MGPTRYPEARRRFLRSFCLLLIVLLTAVAALVHAASAVSFLPPITYERPVAVPLAGADGVPLLIADLDGDGRLDLVVFTQNGISLLYGNGDGTLQDPVDIVLGQNLQEGVAADVNGDGLLDLVICDRGLSKVLVLLNRGGRTFSAPISYPLGTEPLGVVAGDFNGDGAVDLAVTGGGAGVVSVLINRGDGAFQPPVSYRGARLPSGIVTADFDGDGHLDLAVTSLTENVVLLLLGDGHGKFRDGGRYPTGAGNANRLVTDDFNGDGAPDLAVASSGTISMLFGDGKGRFGPPVLYDGYHLLDKGDFDGDGAPDLVTPGASVGGFFLHLNREGGNFLSPMLISGPGDRTGGVRAGDFNGDGRPDIVAWNVGSPHLAIYLNDTPQPTPAVRSLTINPGQVIGGQPAMGRVAITHPAGPDGLAVLLASSSPSVSVPASVTIPPGAASAVFPILTYKVAAATTVTITAGPPGAVTAASLQLLPPTVSPGPPVPSPATLSLALFPNPVPSGMWALGQVTLARPAGAGGALVTLTSSSPSVVVVSPIAVPEGSSAATFPILTFPVSQPTAVTITAAGAGGSASAALQLLPLTTAPSPAPVSANLLVNGSFEEPQGDRFGVGSGVPGWRILEGTIDILTASYWQSAPDGGSQSIDLDGESVGTIEQSFPTVPGQDYLFSGYVSHNPSVSYGRANVFLNGVFFTQLAHEIPNRNTGMQWQQFAYRFRAAAATTTLTLSDVTGINDKQGTVLDGLSVMPAMDLTVNGVGYVAAGPSETLTATFTRPDGGVTAGSYQGYVLLHVTGVGQSYGATYNDAFYLYTAPFTAPRNGHDGGYYQLTFGAGPLQPFSLGSNAENFLVGSLPPYNLAHDYTFVLNTRLASPGRLHFGVSDGGYNDNTGAYTITVTQLVASP